MKITHLLGRAAVCCVATLLGAAALAQTTVPQELPAPGIPWRCPGNIVTNPGFNVNTVVSGDGSMPQSHTQAWTLAYGTPQLQLGAGCHDTDYISFWGNQATGEAIQQPATFIASHTYSISFCARFVKSPGKVIPYVNIVLRASTSQLTTPACPSGSCETITTTPNISSTNWNTYTACWTPSRNESILTVSPSNGSSVNDGSQMSFGQVDDICIREITPPVIEGPKDKCTAPATYCVKQPATGPYNWTVTGGTATPVSSDGSCALVIWNNSGPGTITVTSTAAGCPVTSTIQVAPCEHHLCEPACDAVRAKLTSAVMASGGEQLTFTFNSATATSVKATVLSASHVVTGHGCGPSGPITATIGASQPPPPSGWQPPVVPYLNGNQVVWTSQSATGNPMGAFSVDVSLPGTGSISCNDKVTICIEFEVNLVVNGSCHTCTYVECYTFDRCPSCQ